MPPELNWKVFNLCKIDMIGTNYTGRSAFIFYNRSRQDQRQHKQADSQSISRQLASRLLPAHHLFLVSSQFNPYQTCLVGLMLKIPRLDEEKA